MERAFPVSAGSRLPVAHNNRYAKEANSGVVSPGNLQTAQGKRHFRAYQDLHRIDIPGQKAHTVYDAAFCPEQRADVGTVDPAA